MPAGTYPDYHSSFCSILFRSGVFCEHRTQGEFYKPVRSSPGVDRDRSHMCGQILRWCPGRPVGGMPQREAAAVGFAMVSVAAMGIIVGMLALEAEIIRQRLFVALVIMAIVTAMMSGPAMQIILRPIKKRQLQDLLSPKLFFQELKATSPREAIHEMTMRMCQVMGLDSKTVEAAVWAREDALSTGIGNGVALPMRESRT